MLFHHSAFTRLAMMNAKDMLRDRLFGLAPMFLFCWLLVIYYALALMLPTLASNPETHPLRAALPSILMTGIAAVAFMSTAVPLVSMRENGLLRLLGTTPLKRQTFLLALLPSRLVFVALEVAVILAVMQLTGHLSGAFSFWRMFVTITVGSAMLFSCAILIASRARNAESVHQLTTMLVMGLFIFSGVFLPPGTLPSFTDFFANMLPSTWFAAALGADLIGATPFFAVPALWAMMCGVTVVVTVVTLRRFEWDQVEDFGSVKKLNGDISKRGMVA